MLSKKGPESGLNQLIPEASGDPVIPRDDPITGSSRGPLTRFALPRTPRSNNRGYLYRIRIVFQGRHLIYMLEGCIANFKTTPRSTPILQGSNNHPDVPPTPTDRRSSPLTSHTRTPHVITDRTAYTQNQAGRWKDRLPSDRRYRLLSSEDYYGFLMGFRSLPQ